MTASGKTYRDKSLSLDGKHFKDCVFDRCRLDYAGGLPPVLSGCRFDNCSFSFSGHAAYTLGFLGGLHAGGFQQIVEQTFQAIRDGAYRAMPAQDIDPKTQPKRNPDIHPLGLRTPRVIEILKRR